MKARLAAMYIAAVSLLVCFGLADDVRFYRIVSPSMEPLIPVGSLVVVSASEPVEVGDVVAYKLDVGGRSYTLVHRVVGVENGHYAVRADADPAGPGEAVEAGEVMGKVVLAMPLIGYFSGALPALPALILLIPLAWGRGGIGFPAAAFTSFLASILPVRGPASSIGQIPFSAAMAGAVAAVRMVLEGRDRDAAELVYLAVAAACVASLDLAQVVGWFAA